MSVQIFKSIFERNNYIDKKSLKSAVTLPNFKKFIVFPFTSSGLVWLLNGYLIQ